MNFIFRSCINLQEIDISKLNTKNVKSMKAMFASCFSLDELNLTNINFSNVVDSSYMIYNTYIRRLDLSDFSGSSNEWMKNTLKFNRKLKYINILNYQGKNIFNNIFNRLDVDENITICTYNEKIEDNSNSFCYSKIKENITNNSSNMYFYKFSRIKEEKKVGEVDCSKIEDENNNYHSICVNNEENNTMDSTISESTTISETNNESMSSSNIGSISSSNVDSTSSFNNKSISSSNSESKTIVGTSISDTGKTSNDKSTKIESSDKKESKIVISTLNEERTTSTSTDIEVTTPQSQANIANQTSLPYSLIKQHLYL